MHTNNDSQNGTSKNDAAQFMNSKNTGSEFYIAEDSISDDMVPTLTIPAEDVPFNMSVLTLSDIPFSEKINSRMFYEEKACKQCLDMLLHLSQYSDLVINVTGEYGAGKTTLLYQTLDQLGEKIFSTTFDAALVEDKEQLERELCSAFNVSEDSVGKLDFFESLEVHVEAIARKFSSAVLLIDNAHEMSGVVLSHLGQLVNIKDDAGNSLLHIILFGEPSITQKLEQVFPDKLKTQNLTSYSRKDTGNYLRHRSNVAGMSLERYEEIFDAANILNIYTLSNGIPAKINELANNRLQEVSDKLAPSERSLKLQSLSRRQLFSSAVILLLMLAAWFFQVELKQYSVMSYQRVVELIESQGQSVTAVDDEKVAEDSVEDNAEETVAENNITGVESSSGSKNKVVDDVQVNDAVPVENEVLTAAEEMSIAESVTEEVVDVTEQLNAELQQLTKNDEGQVVAVQMQSPQVAPAESPVQQLDTLKTSQSLNQDEVGEAFLTGLKSSVWLLEQDPQQFTVQVFGAADEKTVLDTVKKYKLLEAQPDVISNVALFQTKKKNRNWYSLVVGQYSDIESAKSASTKLPKVFVKGAWVRRNKSVQQDIAKINSKLSLVDASNVVSGEMRREKWLLAQDAQQFTLQLFGSNKESSIEQFIKTYQLDSIVAYFKTQKKGGDWFALTYGAYANLQGAKAAVNGLPEKLKKQVWIRKFKNIHQDIQVAAP